MTKRIKIGVLLLMVSVKGSFAQTMTEDYKSAWKLKTVKNDTAHMYDAYQHPQFFVGMDGKFGFYLVEENNVNVNCCWTRKGNALILKHPYHSFHIKSWNQKEIVLTDSSHSSIELVLVK